MVRFANLPIPDGPHAAAMDSRRSTVTTHQSGRVRTADENRHQRAPLHYLGGGREEHLGGVCVADRRSPREARYRAASPAAASCLHPASAPWCNRAAACDVSALSPLPVNPFFTSPGPVDNRVDGDGWRGGFRTSVDVSEPIGIPRRGAAVPAASSGDAPWRGLRQPPLRLDVGSTYSSPPLDGSHGRYDGDAPRPSVHRHSTVTGGADFDSDDDATAVLRPLTSRPLSSSEQDTYHRRQQEVFAAAATNSSSGFRRHDNAADPLISDHGKSQMRRHAAAAGGRHVGWGTGVSTPPRRVLDATAGGEFSAAGLTSAQQGAMRGGRRSMTVTDLRYFAHADAARLGRDVVPMHQSSHNAGQRQTSRGPAASSQQPRPATVVVAFIALFVVSLLRSWM